MTGVLASVPALIYELLPPRYRSSSVIGVDALSMLLDIDSMSWILVRHIFSVYPPFLHTLLVLYLVYILTT